MAKSTTTKDKTQAQTLPPEQPTKGQEVVRLAAERLPYHPLIEERFGVDRAGWRVLVESIWPGAQSLESVIMALSYCRARQLDPFKRPVHIVPVYNSALRKTVETVWPSISELRTTAMRTGSYAGCDPCVFGDDIEKTFFGENRDHKEEQATVTFPEWAQITLYRMLQGNRVPFPGPRVYWEETYATKSHFSELPNSMWEGRPRGQLEKCAEAAALRRAYPEELGGEYAAEEMAGRVVDHGGAPATRPTERPRREDYLGKPAIEVPQETSAKAPIEPETKPKAEVKPEPINAPEQAADQKPAPEQQREPDETADWLGKQSDLADSCDAMSDLDHIDDQVCRELAQKNREDDLRPKWNATYKTNRDRLKGAKA